MGDMPLEKERGYLQDEQEREKPVVWKEKIPYAWQLKREELEDIASKPDKKGVHWDFVRDELIPFISLAVGKKERLQHDFKMDYTRKVNNFLHTTIDMVLRSTGSIEEEVNKYRAYIGYMTNGAIPENDASVMAEILSFESFVEMRKPKMVVVGDPVTGLRPI